MLQLLACFTQSFQSFLSRLQIALCNQSRDFTLEVWSLVRFLTTYPQHMRIRRSNTVITSLIAVLKFAMRHKILLQLLYKYEGVVTVEGSVNGLN